MAISDFPYCKKQTIIMRTTFRHTLLACTALMGLAACSNIDYDGEYSKDGYYDSPNQVYFYYANASDTLINYSFGVKPVDTLTHTVYIPVQLAGKMLDREQTFNVSVDAASTAKSGVHYVLSATSFNIPANEKRAYVPIQLLRTGLSETKYDSIRVVLRLVPSNDLGVRFAESNKVTVTFDNILMKPDFWEIMETYWGLGPFTKNKYRKLLSYYDSDEDKIRKILTGTDTTAQGYLYMHVQEVVAYFAAHPNEL